MVTPTVLLLLVSRLSALQDPWVPPVAEGPDPLPAIDTAISPSGVVPLPADVDERIARWFDRYSKVVAPNGKPIHILASSAWTEGQIVHARKVLEHYLTDVPGSRFGADKSAVANAMADRRATMALFDTERDLHRAFRGPFGEVELGVQDLRANECPADGDADYMRHDTRDAAFEEVLHLVQDYGIRPALRAYDEELHAANVAATEAGLWRGWPDDKPENHRTEYLAAIYDNYLDLWAVKPTTYEAQALEPDDIPDGTSHFGRYRANSRARLLAVDPDGHALLEAFFPPYLTYTAELPADFEGTFSLRRDPALRYTAKSQHLVKVALTGANGGHLIGNAWDNELTGGAGDDVLEGHEGDDAIDGGAGRDVAVFAGLLSEYTLTRENERTLVVDRNAARDDRDELRCVEIARFADFEVLLDER